MSSGPGSCCIMVLGKTLDFHSASLHLDVYSCFEKGCLAKPNATIAKGTMGSWGPWSLIEALGQSSDIKGNSTNKCI